MMTGDITIAAKVKSNHLYVVILLPKLRLILSFKDE